MGWRNFPRWLRWGTIFGLTYIILIIFLFLMGFIAPINKTASLITTFFDTLIVIFSIPGTLIFLLFFGQAEMVICSIIGYESFFSCNRNLLIAIFFSLIIYIFIGALIGWIVGKIRKR